MLVGSRNVEASNNLLGDKYRDDLHENVYKKNDWMTSSSSKLNNHYWSSPQKKIKDRGTKYRQQDEKRINDYNIKRNWSNHDENWTEGEQDHEKDIPRLRMLSSTSQTTMSTDPSTIVDKDDCTRSTFTGDLSKHKSKSNSIFTDNDDESLSTVHSNHTGEYDDFESNYSHSSPNTLLSSPVKFWKRIGFYWCQLNGDTETSNTKKETTTCCISSKFSGDQSDFQGNIGDSRIPSRESMNTKTPRASKKKSSSGEVNLSPSSVPIHLLRTAKRGNGTLKTRERWCQQNMHDEHTPATDSTTSNFMRTNHSGESRISLQPDCYYAGWDGRRNHFMVTSPEKNDGSTFDAKSFYYSTTKNIQRNARDDVIHHQLIPRKVFTNTRKKIKQYEKATYCSNAFWSSPLSTASSDSSSSSSVFWSPVERKMIDNFLGSDSDDDSDNDDENTLSPITTTSFYEKGPDALPLRERVDTFDTAQSYHTRDSAWYDFDEKSLGQIFSTTSTCIDDEILAKKDKRDGPISHILTRKDYDNDDIHQIISPCSTITNATEIQQKPLNVIPSNDITHDIGKNNHQTSPIQHHNLSSKIEKRYRQTNSENDITENSSNKENIKSICNGSGKYFTPMSGLNFPLELNQNDYLTIEGWIVCHLKSTMPKDEESIVKNHCFYMRCYKSLNDGAILYLWRSPTYPDTKTKNSKLRKNNRKDDKKNLSLHSTLAYTSTKMEMVSQSLGHGVTVETINKESGEEKELFIMPLCIDYETYMKARITTPKMSSPSSNLKSAMARRLLKNSANEDTNREVSQPMSRQHNGEFLSSSSQQTNATLHLLFCLDIANQKKLVSVSPQGNNS